MKALIIEDESLVADELQYTLREIAPDINVIDVLPSLKTAKNWFMQNAEQDILLMDIRLSDGLSFELFDQYSLRCPVIFTTAYEEYAIRAFRVNGVDYLLKPVQADDLKKAIDKVRNMVDSKSFVPGNLQQLM